jgi:branched-chain amino acid transport system ATP-binding protein
MDQGGAVDEDVILATDGLAIEFKGFRAVDGVALRVRRGTIHALIGPNGAARDLLQSPHQVPYPGGGVDRYKAANHKTQGRRRAARGSCALPDLGRVPAPHGARERAQRLKRRKRGDSFEFWRSEQSLACAGTPRRWRWSGRFGLKDFAALPAGRALLRPQARARDRHHAALDPEMLLLDEPMAGMSHEDVERIAA